MVSNVSAREANQRFAEVLGKAASGETIVITRRGKPVAKLVPYRPEDEDDTRLQAWDRLLSRLETGLPLDGSTFDRDSLYDR